VLSASLIIPDFIPGSSSLLRNRNSELETEKRQKMVRSQFLILSMKVSSLGMQVWGSRSGRGLKSRFEGQVKV